MSITIKTYPVTTGSKKNNTLKTVGEFQAPDTDKDKLKDMSYAEFAAWLKNDFGKKAEQKDFDLESEIARLALRQRVVDKSNKIRQASKQDAAYQQFVKAPEQQQLTAITALIAVVGSLENALKAVFKTDKRVKDYISSHQELLQKIVAKK